MSVKGTVISNLDGLVFNKGYMYGTRQSGTTDAIAWGALQNVSLSHEFTTVEMRGPEALPPLAVGIAEENLTGTFDAGVIHPEQLVAALGGSMVVSGSDTVYTKLVNQEPLPFNLHFESGVSGNDDMDLLLYNCLMPTWSLRADNRGFAIGSSSFKVYGQAVSDGGVLFKMTKPGDLTNAS